MFFSPALHAGIAIPVLERARLRASTGGRSGLDDLVLFFVIFRASLDDHFLLVVFIL